LPYWSYRRTIDRMMVRRIKQLCLIHLQSEMMVRRMIGIIFPISALYARA
jgi:hypothetical protein